MVQRGAKCNPVGASALCALCLVHRRNGCASTCRSGLRRVSRTTPSGRARARPTGPDRPGCLGTNVAGRAELRAARCRAAAPRRRDSLDRPGTDRRLCLRPKKRPSAVGRPFFSKLNRTLRRLESRRRGSHDHRGKESQGRRARRAPRGTAAIAAKAVGGAARREPSLRRDGSRGSRSVDDVEPTPTRPVIDSRARPASDTSPGLGPQRSRFGFGGAVVEPTRSPSGSPASLPPPSPTSRPPIPSLERLFRFHTAARHVTMRDIAQNETDRDLFDTPSGVTSAARSVRRCEARGNVGAGSVGRPVPSQPSLAGEAPERAVAAQPGPGAPANASCESRACAALCFFARHRCAVPVTSRCGARVRLDRSSQRALEAVGLARQLPRGARRAPRASTGSSTAQIDLPARLRHHRSRPCSVFAVDDAVGHPALSVRRPDLWQHGPRPAARGALRPGRLVGVWRRRARAHLGLSHRQRCVSSDLSRRSVGAEERRTRAALAAVASPVRAARAGRLAVGCSSLPPSAHRAARALLLLVALRAASAAHAPVFWRLMADCVREDVECAAIGSAAASSLNRPLAGCRPERDCWRPGLSARRAPRGAPARRAPGRGAVCAQSPRRAVLH